MRIMVAMTLVTLLAGCAKHAPMKTVDEVDIPQFMGKWYVIANIPTFLEKGAHNAIEHYALNPDGTIATTFTYNADSFDGELKTYTAKGFIQDKSTNALWGMQFLWPIKADYRVVYLDEDYQKTIIARKARDYVWLMSRTPTITEEAYLEFKKFIKNLGYDVSKLERVPQSSE